MENKEHDQIDSDDQITQRTTSGPLKLTHDDYEQVDTDDQITPRTFSGPRKSSKELYALLSKYCRQGRTDDLNQLIALYTKELKSCVNKLDSTKLSPLHYAARNGQLGCIELLLEKLNADINVEGVDKTTPLHFAARFKSSTGSSDDSSPTVHKEIFSPSTGMVAAFLDVDTANLTQNAPMMPLFKPTLPRIVDQVIHYLVQHGAELNRPDADGLTALHYAAIRGNEVASQQLIMENIDIDLPDHDGMRPLHLAAAHSEFGIAMQLIEAGADPLVVNKRDSIPLHLSCASGNLKLVRLLLDACRKDAMDRDFMYSVIDVQNVEGESPIHWAVANGQNEVMEYLIGESADVHLRTNTGETCLHMAARVGYIKTAELLLSNGVDVDAEDILLQTPLHKAADRNNAHVVSMLLDYGSDMENQDHDGFTPLLLAASHGNADVVNVLLDRGANPFIVDKNSRGIVHQCVKDNQYGLLESILERADLADMIGIPDIYNDTPLHIAVKLGYLNMTKLLLDKGAPVSVKNEKERTPFHYAAKYGWPKIAELLVAASSTCVSDRDECGNTPIHLASANGYRPMIEFLLDAGATVDSRNNLKWTPLDCAAVEGHYDCAVCLLEHGSPVDPRDVSNVTPMHLACKNGHANLVTLLLEWGADPSIRMVVDEKLSDYGPNALDMAIEHKQKSCALCLLQSPIWKKVLRNQMVDDTGHIQTPMRKLIKYMPDIADYVMTRCIRPVTGENVEKFNFEFIDDGYEIWSSSAMSNRIDDLTIGVAPANYLRDKFKQLLKSNRSHHSSEQGSDEETSRPYSNDSEMMKENHPLLLMVKYNRPLLLQHRLVSTLLDQKWKHSCWIYYVNLSIYLLFLISLTVYMQYTQPIRFIAINGRFNVTDLTDYEICTRYSQSIPKVEFPILMMVLKTAVLALSIFNLAKELFQFCLVGYRYLNLTNLIEFSIFTLAIICVINYHSCLSQFHLKTAWQWQCGAVAILLSWLNLLLFLRLIPTLGMFVLMFTVIMRTFAKFSIVFSLFVLAFALGFNALLYNHPPFDGLFRSFSKTAVMTLGELEFDDTIGDPDQLVFATVTYLLFFPFLIVMTIVIMNLLVGLAVDDIKEVQNRATVKRLAMQIQLLLDLESLPLDIFRKHHSSSHVVLESTDTSLKPSVVSRLRRHLRKKIEELDQPPSEEELRVEFQVKLTSLDNRISQMQTGINRIIKLLNDPVPSGRSHRISFGRAVTCDGGVRH